jgi:hypothetical protein
MKNSFHKKFGKNNQKQNQINNQINNQNNNQNNYQNNNLNNNLKNSNSNANPVETKENSNSKRILLFPGENYEFNEKLIHYDVFGYSKENLVSKKCSLINISNLNITNINIIFSFN